MCVFSSAEWYWIAYFCCHPSQNKNVLYHHNVRYPAHHPARNARVNQSARFASMQCEWYERCTGLELGDFLQGDHRLNVRRTESASHNTKRTVHRVGGDWVLRITHMPLIMGPAKFVNVGHGGYSAPWGIWTLCKVDGLSNFDDRRLTSFVDLPICSLTDEEARVGHAIAKRYTHTFSTFHTEKAKWLDYWEGTYIYLNPANCLSI